MVVSPGEQYGIVRRKTKDEIEDDLSFEDGPCCVCAIKEDEEEEPKFEEESVELVAGPWLQEDNHIT